MIVIMLCDLYRHMRVAGWTGDVQSDAVSA